MNADEKKQLTGNGFVVLRGWVPHTPAMDRACEALVAWLTTEPDLDTHRYVHAPDFVKNQHGADEFVAVLQGAAEKLLGQGNAEPMPTDAQLLGWFAPQHREGPHIDNSSNSIEATEKLAEKHGVLVENEPVLYPTFNVITALSITSFRLRVWPGAHLKVAEFYRTSNNLHYLLARVNDAVVRKLDQKESEVLTLKCGDVLLLNHLVPHEACEPPPQPDSPWIWPGHGPIGARCYKRFRTVTPDPVGLAAMRDPWHGCRDLT